MSYKRLTARGDKVLLGVARIVKANPADIKGVLVVAIPEKGNAGIVHNACCTLHLLDAIRNEIESNPELNLVNPADRESHGL